MSLIKYIAHIRSINVECVLLFQVGNIQIWTRPVLPEGSFAFAFLNTGTGGTPQKVSIAVKDLGFTKPSGYNITEVFSGQFLAKRRPNDTFTAEINPTGIFFGKATLL